jgi:hypothetical protein
MNAPSEAVTAATVVGGPRQGTTYTAPGIYNLAYSRGWMDDGVNRK